ncbi:DUF1146 family protein [Vagococcus acidifermentans]|uniref:DUF1146 domain-containing protein n=1 Tax=Vagococcus acidifermentans TaxID=564710 RepID=A0A430ATL7_9ENTE|nr:DUF1146 family protein [Vagococcus acidifermentans]RSU11409.1 hypothetical protein CBF27_07870 [Vagococcus acidifermentans]
MQVFGIDAIVRIVSHVTFIYLIFWGFRSVRLDTFFQKGANNTQIRVMILSFSIISGYLLSSFFLEIISLSRNIFVTWLP